MAWLSWLYIPWFKPDAWTLPLPFELPLFAISELKIHPFGVLVALGVLAGMRVSEWQGKRDGIAPWAVDDLVWHVLLVGFLCAYFLNGLFYETDRLLELLRHPSQLFTQWLGLSSFGGFIGASLGAAWWRYRRRIPFLPVGDAVAFGFPLGWMFGRTGCFVAHDHPGRVTDFFLAVDEYRVGMPPFEPRHDLGLYEVFWSMAVFAFFLWLRPRERPRGLYVALLPLLYAPVRFFLDFLRAPPLEQGDIRYAGLTPGQYGSLAFLLVGAAVLWWVRNRPEGVVPEEARWPVSPPAASEEHAAGVD